MSGSDRGAVLLVELDLLLVGQHLEAEGVLGACRVERVARVGGGGDVLARLSARACGMRNSAANWFACVSANFEPGSTSGWSTR